MNDTVEIIFDGDKALAIGIFDGIGALGIFNIPQIGAGNALPSEMKDNLKGQQPNYCVRFTSITSLEVVINALISLKKAMEEIK